LPVFAGAAIQSNSVSVETVMLSLIAGFASFLLITTSRKYKALKQQNAHYEIFHKKEIILKIISLVVISGTVFYLVLIHL
jgi:heme/copper-type cytochrome/quinol oxidase subunit 2